MDEARRADLLAKINEVAAEWLRGADEAYPEGFDVGTIGLVFDLHLPNETALVGYYCSDSREWVQAGLFRAAMLAAEHREDDADDESDDAA